MMFEQILAFLLFAIGGTVTLYVLYKTAIATLEPQVQKKLAQKMQRDKMSQLQNNLQVGQQLDQQQVLENRKKIQ